MVKQTKTFKKGNVTKKALSAILAASMVMTSSSFVMAAPVEVEAVDVVEDVNAGEESVGATTTYKLSGTFTFDASVVVTDNMTQSDAYNAIVNTIVPRVITTENGSVTNDNNTKLSAYIADIKHHTVTITDSENQTVELTSITMPTKAGKYKISVTGNEKVDSKDRVASGTTTAELNIGHNVSTTISATFKNASGAYVEGSALNAVFTGAEIKPEIKLKDAKNNELKEGKDYTILGYGNNTNVATSIDGDAAPYVEVRFNEPYQQRGDVKYKFTIVKAADLSESNTVVTIQNNKTVYNADVQQPVVKVMYTPAGSTTPIELKENVDYTVTVKKENKTAVVKEPKDAGKYKVLIKGINNYKSSKTGDDQFDIEKEYQIEKQVFNNTTVEVKTPNVTYMGETDTAAVYTLKDAVTGKVLTAPGNSNPEYTIWYYDDSKQGYVDHPVAKKPGTYAIKFVSSNRNYKAGEIKTNYTIVEVGDSLQGMLAKKTVTLGNSTKNVAVAKGNEYTYDKDGTVPATVQIDNRWFYADGSAATGKNDDTDSRYDVEFPKLEDCKDVGTYTIQLKGKGEWEGQTASIEYKVVPKKLDTNEATVLDDTVEVYKDHDGNVTVDFAGKLKDNCGHGEAYNLVQDKDYTYTLKKVNGKYDIEVSYKGNYTGKSVKKGVTVTPLAENKLPLTVESITAEVTGEYLYTGAPIRPSKENIVLKENGRTLVYGIDYKLADSDPYGTAGSNIKVGQGTVTVTGLGSYSGSRVITFDIKAGETVKDNYVLDTTNLKAVYETGTSFNPGNDLKVKTTSGRVLNPTTEYTVKYYRDGKEVSPDVAKTAGTYTMEVTVTETKTVLTAAYRVATSISKAANVKDIADQAFTGSAVEPAVTVVKNATNVELVKGTDYVVSYTNNVKQGTATVTVEGIGDYYGTITKTFKIAGQAEQSIAVLAAQARDIQSRTLNSKPTVVKFEAGKAPKTDVTYASSNEDVVKVDETGKITYTGLGEATITIKAAETAEYKAAEATMTVKVGLAKPSFTPFSKNNAFTLTSSTVKGAEKFEVQYATKKDFSNKKSKTFTATSGKVRQVKVSAGDKTTYFVRVRAISGTTKSAWSATKTVATK